MAQLVADIDAWWAQKGERIINLVQKLCEQRGHRVKYLPPYHPELQPIEMLLAYVKRKVVKLFKGKRSMDQVREETRRAFEDVPISVCAGHFSHCKKVREDLRYIPRATVDDEESETVTLTLYLTSQMIQIMKINRDTTFSFCCIAS